MDKSLKRESICVQGGWQPKKGEPRVLPIYQSTTFKYDTSEQMARLFDLQDNGYFYTRLQNPTNDVVASKIAALEGGVGAILTSSGQAANFFAVFNICEAGDHIVSSNSIYGGTYNLFGVTMKKLGIDVTFINPDDSDEKISAAFRPNTKVLFGEVLSNPGMDVLDIEKFAKIAHNHAKWDREDGYVVPRDCYNSYFYIVEDDSLNIIDKFRLHGRKYIEHLTGGSALHLNLEEHLSPKQYRQLLRVAAQEGCNYFTFNIPNTICNDCGHIDKRYLKECPECHSKNIDYLTRVIGYMKAYCS